MNLFLRSLLKLKMLIMEFILNQNQRFLNYGEEVYPNLLEFKLMKEYLLRFDTYFFIFVKRLIKIVALRILFFRKNLMKIAQAFYNIQIHKNAGYEKKIHLLVHSILFN